MSRILRRLGRYELLEKLATGGMAEIYLAVERGVRGLERLVVIKRILPHLASHESFVDMFAQEARFIARLSHPNVVQIHEFSQEDGEYYIAMEYIPGSSLREVTVAAAASGKPIPVDVAVSMTVQACRGAHAAHELKDPAGQPLGLVHRDISPHNLMVTSEGNVKLLDFGIAKAAQGDFEQTATGTLKGKYAYMSPEQCEHRPLDRRSDVFALGIVLWELLAGERLFRRESEMATLNAIAHEDARDILDARPDVPRPVATALMTSLRRNRDERPATAEDLRKALSAACAEHGLQVSEDVVAPWLRELLGPAHEARKAAVHAAMESTLARTPSDAIADVTRRDRTEAAATVIHPDDEGEARTTPGKRASPAGLTTAEAPLPVNPEAQQARRSRGGSGGAPTRRVPILVAAALAGAVVAGGMFAYLVPPPEKPLSGPPLTLGLAPIHDPVLLAEEMEPLRLYLQRYTGRPVQFTVTADYEDLSRKVIAGELKFGSFPPYLYVMTHARDPRVQVLAFKLFEGSTGTDGVMLVPEDSPASSLKDLKGKRFCYTDRNSTSGYVLPRGKLRQEGLDPDTHPGDVHFSGGHLQLLKDLNAGLCDVGATYSGAYLAADRAGVSVTRMRTLAITGRSPQDAICAGPAATPDERALVGAALLKFDPKKETGVETLGAVQRISGFAPGRDSDYEALRRALPPEVKPAPGEPAGHGAQGSVSGADDHRPQR
ncbi:MAG: serine/threonine-protein kinase [Myxococcota bacterium]